MKTYYEMLKLEKNCSAKEIRDSFLRLSKKYHPDVNKNADAHKMFVEVNEAYSVLGKPSSRLKYDESLPGEKYGLYTSRPITMVRTPYEQYVHMYASKVNRNNAESDKSYFTNSKLKCFCFCCVLMIFGSAMQSWAQLRRRDLRSQEIAASLRRSNARLKRRES